jgi:hypothetical protein
MRIEPQMKQPHRQTLDLQTLATDPIKRNAPCGSNFGHRAIDGRIVDAFKD